MPDRLLSNWLDGYLEFTAEHESPEKIHFWTALSLLSASIRRRVWMERPYYRLYPNLYILIIGDSGSVRKSGAIKMGLRLLKEAMENTVHVARDIMTPEALIKSMNHKVSERMGDKIVEQLRSDVYIFADELANLFTYDRVRAAKLAMLLTGIYDSDEIFEYNTVKDSKIRIYNLYPCLLAATDPRNLKVLPEESVTGLLGRLIWVTAAGRRVVKDTWAKLDTRHALIWEYLIHDLQVIGNLYGEVKPTQKAREFFDEWYGVISSEGYRAKHSGNDPKLNAFLNRVHDCALKIAMLLSIARDDSLQVDSPHLEVAVGIVEQLLPELQRSLAWSGSSGYEQQRAKFIDIMKREGGATTRKKLLRALAIPVEEFDKLTLTLIQDGTLSEKAVKVGNELVFKLATDQLD